MYFIYEVKRYDIKGKDYLRNLSKYYLADLGLRNYLIGYKDEDRGHLLENIVFLELKVRGYEVAIGKLNNKEIDFIATKFNRRIYIQVTESILNEEVRNKELTPLKKISDNFEKSSYLWMNILLVIMKKFNP